MSEDIPRSPCGHQPRCASGDTEALRERDSFRMENRLKMGGESGPRSVNQELHTQPAQKLCGGGVVLLSEARGCVDEG